MVLINIFSYVMETLQASSEGLKKIKDARQKLTAENGWAIENEAWLDEAKKYLPPKEYVSIGTWKRFYYGGPRVKSHFFKAFCQVLGLDWKEIVDEKCENASIDQPIIASEVAEILGDWKSTYLFYQGPSIRRDKWITENVIINIEQTKLRINNYDNPIEDNYVGYGEIVNELYFIGGWQSTRIGRAAGAFMLTLVPMCDMMYGFFTGPRNTGERIYASWVLAREDQDFDRAKSLLSQLIL